MNSQNKQSSVRAIEFAPNIIITFSLFVAVGHSVGHIVHFELRLCFPSMRLFAFMIVLLTYTLYPTLAV